MRVKTGYAAFLVASITMLVVYACSMPPHLTPGMSGAYATGAFHAGVAHPPGHPVWTIYTWLVSHLVPFGPPAWRVTFASALAGAVACGLVAGMVASSGPWFLDGIARFQRLPEREERWLRLVVGSVAGILLGLTSSFWRKAISPEPHIFGILLFCLSLACLARWFPAGAGHRWLWLGALAYGLAVVSSPPLAAACLGLGFVVLMSDRPLGRDLLAWVTLLVALGAGLYLANMWPEILRRLSQVEGLWPLYLAGGLGAASLTVDAGIRTRQLGTHWLRALGLLAVVLSCLVLIFVSPVLSMSNPPINWNYSRELGGFEALIGRGQYEQPWGSLAPDALFERSVALAPKLLNDLGWILMAAALVPVVFLGRLRARSRRWIAGLLMLGGTYFLFILAGLGLPARGTEFALVLPFFTGGYVLVALLAGKGLLILGTIMGRPGLEPARDERAPEGQSGGAVS